MRETPLVSIVINNYNYARFLPEAVESALAQTWKRLEVIVSDDGSTDESRQVIARYGSCVKGVFKENGGQGSAFNTGFACAHGDIILFLDADDALQETTAARVVAAFRANPELAKVHFRLQLMNERGGKLPAFTPPAHVALPSGNLLPRVLQFPDDIPYPPTSGNAYAARVLAQILPMPEAEYRLCADYYLLNLAPLYGLVQSLQGIGGYYRVHGGNRHYAPELDLNEIRQTIIRTQYTHSHLSRAAERLGFTNAARSVADAESVTLLTQRLVSFKLAREKHPVKGDTLIHLLERGVRSAMQHSNLSLPRRLVYALWFALLALLPVPLVRWLAVTFFYRRPARSAV